MDERRAGNHAFNERGGARLKCGMTRNAYWDRNSKQFQHTCTGQKPEQREGISIPDDDE